MFRFDAMDLAASDYGTTISINGWVQSFWASWISQVMDLAEILSNAPSTWVVVYD